MCGQGQRVPARWFALRRDPVPETDIECLYARRLQRVRNRLADWHDGVMILQRLILGLLTLAPMTGYDLKKHFDSSINHFWKADKAQIYRTLAQLVDRGLATVQRVQQENYPDRHEHRITAAGRQVLDEWLASPLEAPTSRDAFLGRVFFAGELEREAVLEMLRERRAQTEEQLREHREQRADIGGHVLADRRAYLMAATLDQGIGHLEAELQWLTAVERELP